MIDYPFLKNKEQLENYKNLLGKVAQLSRLFSESPIPYLNYRVVENAFCKCFQAQNLARADVAYDAKLGNIGIGIKTFINTTDKKQEKIAEFNAKSSQLIGLNTEEKAHQIALWRNERISLANRLYNIKEAYYHYVIRRDKSLYLCHTPYYEIDLQSLHNIRESKGGLMFSDKYHKYVFNESKSTLFCDFSFQKELSINVSILQNPWDILLEIPTLQITEQTQPIPGLNFIILPLYGVKQGEKHIFERSGLNQWNARCRKRDSNEVYVPIPIEIHKLFPHFFLSVQDSFTLTFPDNTSFQAKLCQEAYITINGQKINKGKGLMTSPNKALGEWILRKALLLKERQLATYKMLENIGYDSIILSKKDATHYYIDIRPLGSYEAFIQSFANKK